MIYDVTQKTTYDYASPVVYAHHLLRVMPGRGARQRVPVASIVIEPGSTERREGQDFFGNRVTFVDIAEPHGRLVIDMRARVIVEGRDGAPPTTPAWEDVRAEATASRGFDAAAPAHFLHPSRIVSLDPEIRDYARQSFMPGRPALEGASELMSRIHADFTYEIGVTTVTTTPPMSFALRRGVCQDFAHIMISGLRGLGLPAAYVSGYLRTHPAPGAQRLAGADAMHAWVMVWCGEAAGWFGLDPTNAIPAGDEHIVVAVGRDYADVAPVAGVVVASGGQRLDTSVDVAAVE
jgi:transglutaminase-like putative cysteine protease